MKKHIPGLRDTNGVNITNLNGNWTSKWYSLADFLHLAVQFKWSDSTVEGFLILDYTCDPDGAIYSVKNTVTLDGSFDEQMFLDANLAITSYRFRFVHSLGTANLTHVFHNYKSGE